MPLLLGGTADAAGTTLIDKDDIGLATDLYRDRMLCRGAVLPKHGADQLDLRIRLARLNVTQVVNQQPIGRPHSRVRQGGQVRVNSDRHHISTIAIVTDRQTVRPSVGVGPRYRGCPVGRQPSRDQFRRSWIRRIYRVVDMLNGTSTIVRQSVRCPTAL